MNHSVIKGYYLHCSELSKTERGEIGIAGIQKEKQQDRKGLLESRETAPIKIFAANSKRQARHFYQLKLKSFL